MIKSDFNEQDYRDLKKPFQKAVKDGKQTFIFKGNTYLTEYVKYVLEYLSLKFDKK